MGKAEFYDLVSRTGKAISHGARLRVLEMLAQREWGVGELAAQARLNITTLSAHLQVLREAGLIESRRDGTSVLYRLSDDDVAELLTVLAKVAERHRADVRAARESIFPLPPAPVVSLADARRDPAVVILDVRPAAEYDAGRLPGAVNIPLDELGQRMHEIPDGARVVAYCRGQYCELAHEAARLLRAAGRSASVLDEGVVEWRSRGQLQGVG